MRVKSRRLSAGVNLAETFTPANFPAGHERTAKRTAGIKENPKWQCVYSLNYSAQSFKRVERH
jgi:hypothetical protein